MADLHTTLQARQVVLMQKAKMMLDVAERQQRGLTPAEETAHVAILADIEETGQRLAHAEGQERQTAEIARLTGGASASRTAIDAAAQGATLGASIGAQFVGSEAFQWLHKNRSVLPTGAWTSPSSELQATVLSEDSGSGGQLVVPDYRPGIVGLPQRPLTMADLIMPGTTESNLITFMQETGFTNAAAGVLEAGLKPESTLVFAAASQALVKLATWIPATEELLEDVPGMRSYIDARLRLGVQLTEDTQILNGSGTAPNLNGFLIRAGLATAIARGTDTNADALLRQIAAIQTATNLRPDAIVMHPTNWLTIQLTKAADGTYISGNPPFSAPQRPTLWGLPVVITSAIVANTALVGCFMTAAQLFRKGGLRVEATNSHSDWFIFNKIAIRAEERLALVCYREAAFGKVTGLN